MDEALIKGAIEALLFASTRPLAIDRIRDLLSEEAGKDFDRKDVMELIEEIKGACHSDERGFFLSEAAGGYQFRTKKVYAPLIQKLNARRPPRFGKASMEVLAIVAYRQPVTRAEVEELRGVDSGWALRGLLEKRLLKVLGRKEVPGRPVIYGTSKFFLEHFGLRALDQLPSLKEFVELEEGEEDRYDGLEGLVIDRDQ